MLPFTTHSGIVVAMDRASVDTDQIIPARFLRRAKDAPKYATFLLHDLRFNSDGSETDFIYNRAPYCDGQIVVADINWGCGSSRETAVDALVANHIRAVVAPSFGDIHSTIAFEMACCQFAYRQHHVINFANNCTPHQAHE